MTSLRDCPKNGSLIFNFNDQKAYALQGHVER